jgi:hypothetical protein
MNKFNDHKMKFCENKAKGINKSWDTCIHFTIDKKNHLYQKLLLQQKTICKCLRGWKGIFRCGNKIS